MSKISIQKDINVKVYFLSDDCKIQIHIPEDIHENRIGYFIHDWLDSHMKSWEKYEII